MNLKKKDRYLRHAASQDRYEASLEKLYLASVLLESDHGCQFNLTINATNNVAGASAWHKWDLSSDWASWSDIKHGIIFDNSHSADAIARLNEDCKESEIIIMSTPWWTSSYRDDTFLENITILAYACHAEYSIATIPVRAKSSLKALSLEFDENLFNQMRMPVSSTVLDLDKLHEIYTDTVWNELIPQKDAHDPVSGARVFGGATAMLGTSYNFSVPRMMADVNLPMVAAQFRRRFFTEIVDASLQGGGTLEERRTVGRRLEVVRKC